MIQVDLLRDRNISAIIVDRPLEKKDFEQLSNEIDPLIASEGKLSGLMITAKSFPGWQSVGAFVAHLKFVADHHRRIERVAVVTNSGVLKILPHIARPFVHPKIKQFDSEERDQALTWLETGR